MALAVGLASVFFGPQAVDREIYAAVSDIVGEDVTGLLVDAIARVRSDRSDATLSLVSRAWREIVDIIWKVPRKRGCVQPCDAVASAWLPFSELMFSSLSYS